MVFSLNAVNHSILLNTIKSYELEYKKKIPRLRSQSDWQRRPRRCTQNRTPTAPTATQVICTLHHPPPIGAIFFILAFCCVCQCVFVPGFWLRGHNTNQTGFHSIADTEQTKSDRKRNGKIGCLDGHKYVATGERTTSLLPSARPSLRCVNLSSARTNSAKIFACRIITKCEKVGRKTRTSRAHGTVSIDRVR